MKKEALAQVFPVNFAKFLRTPFLQNTSGRLLLFQWIYLNGCKLYHLSIFACSTRSDFYRLYKIQKENLKKLLESFTAFLYFDWLQESFQKFQYQSYLGSRLRQSKEISRSFEVDKMFRYLLQSSLRTIDNTENIRLRYYSVFQIKFLLNFFTSNNLLRKNQKRNVL